MPKPTQRRGDCCGWDQVGIYSSGPADVDIAGYPPPSSPSSSSSSSIIRIINDNKHTYSSMIIIIIL